MLLKANLHFHTSDDPHDPIDYSTYEGIDAASSLGFQVLAITCHEAFAYTEEYSTYAQKKGILLIPGIERRFIDAGDVVILHSDPAIQFVRSIEELKRYKTLHPDVFVLAPHPFFPGHSLHHNLIQCIDLFDAIEHSWFFSSHINYNTQAREAARKYHLPYIATSDTHFLRFLNSSYAIIEAREKTIPSVFEAIRNHQFQNVSTPRKLFREMLWYMGLILEGRKFFRKFRTQNR